MLAADLLQSRVARIANKVRSRGIRLGPCLSEPEIRSFEERHAIQLPDDYRTFLLQIGNGGSGPAYCGMVGLGESAGDQRGEEGRIWTELPNVTRPFPFRRTWTWESGEESEEGTQDQVCYGSILLGNEGCGMYWHVIVTGPERGNIWMISDEGIQPTSPKRDFLQWYEDWLNGVAYWWDYPIKNADGTCDPSNPFNRDANPERHAIWQRLVAADCEAFAAGDWSMIENDFHAESFEGIRCSHSTNPDDWKVIFCDLAGYRDSWLAASQEFRSRSFASDSLLEALLTRTHLHEIDINGDRALAHKKFFGELRLADGQTLADRRQTLFRLHRFHREWKIVGFLGQLPLVE